jgi:DnaJ-class molecular chaperone
MPHAYFRRDGDNILVELPVSLTEAVLGGRITVPTVTGPVTMMIPKGSDTGTQLRLRGKGIQRRGGEGDQIVSLKVVIGDSRDAELARLLEGWAPHHQTDPRRGMMS